MRKSKFGLTRDEQAFWFYFIVILIIGSIVVYFLFIKDNFSVESTPPTMKLFSEGPMTNIFFYMMSIGKSLTEYQVSNLYNLFKIAPTFLQQNNVDYIVKSLINLGVFSQSLKDSLTVMAKMNTTDYLKLLPSILKTNVFLFFNSLGKYSTTNEIGANIVLEYIDKLYISKDKTSLPAIEIYSAEFTL